MSTFEQARLPVAFRDENGLVFYLRILGLRCDRPHLFIDIKAKGGRGWRQASYDADVDLMVREVVNLQNVAGLDDTIRHILFF